MVWVLVGGFGGRGSEKSGKGGEGGFCGLLVVSLTCSSQRDGGARSTEVWLRGNRGSVIGRGVSDGVRLTEDVGWSIRNWQ